MPDWIVFEDSIAAGFLPWRYNMPDEYWAVVPHDLALQLFDGLPQSWNIEFRDFEPSSCAFTARYEASDPDEIFQSIATFSWETIDPSIDLELLIVNERHRGQGFGTRIASNLITVAQEMGIDVLSLFAALDDGPYFWAAMGFVPTPESWIDIGPPILVMLHRLALDQPNSVTSETVALVENLVAGNDAAAGIRAIADLDRLVHSVVYCDHTGVPLVRTLGKALLADSHCRWSGVLDLSDQATFDYISDFLFRY